MALKTDIRGMVHHYPDYFVVGREKIREYAKAVQSAEAVNFDEAAAADPANPYGAALPWPTEADTGHRPGRKAGALVVLVDGELTWFLERGGRSLLAFSPDAEAHAAAATALVELVGAGRLQSLLVERINGVPVLESGAGPEHVAVQDALTGSGFSRTPRGLRLR